MGALLAAQELPGTMLVGCSISVTSACVAPPHPLPAEGLGYQVDALGGAANNGLVGIGRTRASS